LLEPDVVVPVHTGVMHPLLGVQVYQGTFQVWAQEAVGDLNRWFLMFIRFRFSINQILAPGTKPWIIILHILILIEISPVTGRVHDHHAQVTLSQEVIVFRLC